MEILNEKEIIDKCKLLNKSFIDIDTNSIEEFCIKNVKSKAGIMQLIAIILRINNGPFLSINIPKTGITIIIAPS